MRLRDLLVALFAQVGLAGGAWACQPTYTVQDGDTLFTIAEEQIGDLTQWSLIFYNNPSLQGGSLLDVPVGVVLNIPCPEGTVNVAPDPTPLQQVDAELKLLTGSDYAPFTDKAWPGQGMVTELVNAAFENTPSPLPFAIVWEDDWSKHLSPMLEEKTVDMGFPWYRPDCEGDPSQYRCNTFHFSDPLLDLVILFFVRSSDPMKFETDTDVHGKTLCRPAGFFTHDLDQDGRNWLADENITLITPATAADCFDLLMQGEADAVAVNEFLGTEIMYNKGLQEQVKALAKPISVQGLHVVISKKHWRGTTHLYRFNAGLAALKQSDRYNEIVSRHLNIFWDRLKG
jgi:polar amino acid transport system substrate-binding protein